MVGIGTIVNAATIVTGGLLGTLLVQAVPAEVKETVMRALGLCVILIGLKLASTTNDLLMVIVSMALGAGLGEAAQLEQRLETAAQALETWATHGRSGSARTFVGLTLLFCVGPMAITGAFADGLKGDPSILYAKAVLDGVGAAMFASVLGVGVVLTAIPVLVYQMALTIGAGLLSHLLTEPMIHEMNATGGLLVLALGLNLTGIGQFKVANLLPALLVVIIAVATKGLLTSMR